MQKVDEARTAGVGALLWLAVATFSMGIDGYVLAVLLPQIADDFEVTEAAAGQLMTVFAFTGAVGGPLLGALTGRWERKVTSSARWPCSSPATSSSRSPPPMRGR